MAGSLTAESLHLVRCRFWLERHVLIELPLHGRLGDALERVAARLARARLRAHYGACGATVPEEVTDALDAGVSLRFHGHHAGSAMVARYTARRAEVASMLDRSAGRAAKR